ncbi:hypothetical protein PanWU01x14_046560 [Parasponia andersonii]|uniref:Uncharacterized protein n=1 Tax=Parasponia andersonii TaxID=3476 RepID=A0A2P5DNQ9_PARAD|nr:hypothetical protein PanWU01x14_046560 [Parasponia andersonii]
MDNDTGIWQAQRIEATLISDKGIVGGNKGKGNDEKMRKSQWQGQGSLSSGCNGSFGSSENGRFAPYS